MANRDRDETGQFRERLTPDDVLGVFDEVRGPVITSSDVAETLDCSTEAARQKLRQLYDRGDVDRRKTGRTTVWWFTGGERITPDERGDKHAESARERHEERRAEEPDRTDAPDASTPTAGEDRDDDGRESERLTDLVDDVAESWEDPPERIEARKAAARAVLEYAREHGEVSKQEAKEEVYPEYPVENQNARTWYRKNIRPALNAAAEYDNTVKAYRLTVDLDGGDEALDSNVYDPTEEFDS